MASVTAVVAAFAIMAFGSDAAAAKQQEVASALPPVAAFVPAPGRALCRGSDGYANASGGLRTFLWRPEWMAAEKAAVAADPDRARRLRDAADAALARGPYTVTAKSRKPDSGDVHDYVSIGPYWWPDSSADRGAPYVRKDGQINPERSGNAFDVTRLQAFSDDVRILALAYHHLGNKRYAEHAARLLKVWFVDPATRMNPNLNYAQAVPGRSPGRGEGVIDAFRLMPVVESIGLLVPSGALSDTDNTVIEDWFGALVKWMATSANGRAERAKTNNHGVYYDMMLVQFVLYADLETVAQTIVRRFPATRLAMQIAPDGSVPEELSRTRSWHYAHWVADGMTRTATMAECVGLDLWHWTTPDGRGIRRTVDWLAPYQSDLKKWPHKDIELSKGNRRAAMLRDGQDVLREAAWGYHDVALGRAAEAQDVQRNVDDAFWLPPYPADTSTRSAARTDR